MSAQVPGPGLVDPIHHSQSVFRTIMNAMARPGSIQALPQPLDPPPPLQRTVGLILLSLADVDTPLWLDARLAASDAVADWLRFHAGAPITSNQSEAAIAVISESAHIPSPGCFANGSIEYPDRSATLIMQVDQLANHDGLLLEGPGIAGRRLLSVDPVGPNFAEQLRQNHANAPRGVDFILAAEDCIAALPRSTKIVNTAGGD